MNGHDPYAYLKDVLTRLPTQLTSEITELLPHKWAPLWLIHCTLAHIIGVVDGSAIPDTSSRKKQP